VSVFVALGGFLTLGVGAGEVGGVACTLGDGTGVLWCCGVLAVAGATLGAVTVSVTVAGTLGTARLVVINGGVCGVVGANMVLSWASMALVGSPVCRKGSAVLGSFLTMCAISSMAAARRSWDEVWGMLTFVGKNSTVFDTRSAWVAET
jgi:hypothetical protein